jgi:hypothetical protein
MPDWIAPGVYIEEIPSRTPISGVSTSVAGFVGLAERGPEYPRLLTSLGDYRRWFGEPVPQRSYLADAVWGFFANGGQRCYIARVVPAAAQVATANIGPLQINAIGRGEWGRNIFVKLEPSGALADGVPRYRLGIWYYRVDSPRNNPDPTQRGAADYIRPDEIESYGDLPLDEGAQGSLIKDVTFRSRLVRLDWDGTSTEKLPAEAVVVRLKNDTADVAPGLSDFTGDPQPGEEGDRRGLQALAAINGISLLCVPDEVHPTLAALRDPLRAAILDQCEARRDRFAILSVEQGRAEVDLPRLEPPRDTSFGAIYYPWIAIPDRETREKRLVPPTGHIAGIYARTDLERGVHKAPANQELRGVWDLEFPVTQAIQESLNPRRINCLRDFRTHGSGTVVWGARTMSTDPEWKYVNIRRLFIFVEQSIVQGTQWAVFEPNDEPLWALLRKYIDTFLSGLWRNGALSGAKPEQAYFVRCDRSTMTQDDIDNGRLVCLVGLAAIKPAEFTILRLSWKMADTPD